MKARFFTWGGLFCSLIWLALLPGCSSLAPRFEDQGLPGGFPFESSPLIEPATVYSEIQLNETLNGWISAHGDPGFQRYRVANVPPFTRLFVELSGPANADFDLRVWSAGDWKVCICVEDSVGKAISFTVPELTDVWIYISALQGEGAFTLRAIGSQAALSGLEQLSLALMKDVFPVSQGYLGQTAINGTPDGKHAGIDFDAPRGTPVYALSGGVITNVDRELKGAVYVFDGANTVIYLHMTDIPSYVESDIALYPGAPIGRVGNVGTRDFHLHVEVRRGYQIFGTWERASYQGSALTEDITLDPVAYLLKQP